jgi:hypothetical protein
MQESTLLKLAMIFSIIGVIILYFISQTIKFPEGTLMEEDSNYAIQGTIEKVTQKESITYLDLKRGDNLNVVLFKDYPVDLNKGDYVEIIGKASKDQNGEMQLIAKDVRVVK